VHAGARETVVNAVAAAPSVLVLSQAWYPGWNAVVDGAETPALRVNHGFVGVTLEAGAHEVRFLYRPASLCWGIGISGAAIAGAALGLLAGRRRRRAP
jgi:uncharacterized membrane protein YfhO